MSIRFIILIVWVCLISDVQANSLYLEAIKAQPDAKQLEASREKVLEYKEVKIRDDLDKKLPPFHLRVEKQINTGETFCQLCHLPLPHRESIWTRALLNMHSRSIACGTCHFRPRNTTFAYRWLDFSSEKAVTGDAFRFRAGRDWDNENLPDGNVKIAPFWQDNPAIPFPESSAAQAIEREWRDGDTEQKIQLHARLHAPLEQKGLACEGCHQEEKPLFSLQALGANPEQTKQIQRHVIPQFFKRYRDKEQKIRILDLTR